MTWRTIWIPSGSYFPAWADHRDERDAHAHALKMSRAIGGEVAVVELPTDVEEQQ